MIQDRISLPVYVKQLKKTARKSVKTLHWSPPPPNSFSNMPKLCEF